MQDHPWVGKMPWRRAWQPTPVVLPGESHGQRSLVGYSPWGQKELDMTEVTQHAGTQRVKQEWGAKKEQFLRKRELVLQKEKEKWCDQYEVRNTVWAVGWDVLFIARYIWHSGTWMNSWKENILRRGWRREWTLPHTYWILAQANEGSGDIQLRWKKIPPIKPGTFMCSVSEL